MAELDSKQIKEKLQKTFPKFKFSVTRSSFANGHSVSVRILSGNIKAMKDESELAYASGLQYGRESDKLTIEMNAFLNKVRDIIEQVGNYNNRHGSSWLDLSLGSWDKAYVFTSSASTPRARIERYNYNFGELVMSGSGWDLFKKDMTNIMLYTLVKKYETIPNREKWAEIRGLIWTQEAFKWYPKYQAFQRYSSKDIPKDSVDNLFRILSQYYEGAVRIQIPMPTPEPQPTQAPQIDYTRFATSYDPNNINLYDLLYYPNENKLIRIDSFLNENGNPIDDSRTLTKFDSVVIEYKNMGEIKKSTFSFKSFSEIIDRGEFIYLGEVESGDVYERNEHSVVVPSYILKYEITIATKGFIDYNYTHNNGLGGQSDSSRDYFTYTLIEKNFSLTKRRGIVLDEPQSTPSGVLREITMKEAKSFANAMSTANDSVWRMLNINSASEIYTNQDLQDKYVERMKTSLNNRLKMVFPYILTDIKNGSLKKIFYILEEENQLVLNNFLALSGFYGDVNLRAKVEDYNDNPKDNLKPFINQPESTTPTPPSTSDNDINFQVGNLLIVKNYGSINLIAEVNPSQSDSIVTHFFSIGNDGMETIAFTEDYWREMIKDGEVVLLKDLEEGDIFQKKSTSFYYKIISTYPNDKNVRYSIIGNLGQTIQSFVVDKYDFKLSLVKNEFKFLFHVPSVMLQQQTQESKKEKLEKAIKGLQIMADRGNEKAKKGIEGLKILLKNINK